MLKPTLQQCKSLPVDGSTSDRIW